MYFQNIEFYETKNFQYLLLHKNGCQSILKCLNKLNYSITKNLNNKIRWTVVREPYERFISGLSYDLKKNNLTIEDINLDELFTCYHEINSKFNGFINHTCYQTLYLINTNIDWYIDLKDLNLFLKMHFNETFHENKKTYELKLSKKIKNKIKEYLKVDYYIYNMILTSERVWKWQKGKIF